MPYTRFFSRALLSIFCLVQLSTEAQQTQVYKPTVSRVLFLLDVSGSMKEDWNGRNKIDVAKDLLYKLIDSVEKKNPNVEFAVRAFGYQSPRADRNCKDSKLLVPFAKNNAENIRRALDKITPQGMTPIAYSLLQAPADFPADQKSLNSIIIITDGNENCDGNPCKSSLQLIEKRITVRPFIVGLNVGEKNAAQFKCIGTFLDAKTDSAFYNTVGVIIKQTLNTTTTQINLLNANANPVVTNVPFTLYDHSTRKVLYNFIHTLNEKGHPDTLFLDPVGIYDLELHTIPPIRKENIELTPGKHNIIALDVPLAPFSLPCLQANYSNNDAQLVMRTTDRNILNVQDLNTTENYLKGNFYLQLLTTPAIQIDTTLLSFAENAWTVSHYGTVSLMSDRSYLASIYTDKKMVEQFELKGKTANRKLQPGKYRIVYKPTDSYESESTRTRLFEVIEGQNTVLNLQEP
jgi:Ca-activated chloride channel family protein